MDITEHLQSSRQITYIADIDGQNQDYPCTVKKTKEKLIAVILEPELKDSPACVIGKKITLKWDTDNNHYSLITKVVQNKTFPLVVLNKQGEICEGAESKEVTPEAVPDSEPAAASPPTPVPVAEPEEVLETELAPAPPEAPPEKVKDERPVSLYSQAEKKSLDQETFDYIRDLINEVPQLYSLGPDEVVSLVSYVSYKSVKKGALIFREGEPGNTLFYIVSGAVDIVKESVEGNPIKLAQFTQDSMLGEMALIDSAPRSAAAKVASDVELIILSRESFEGLLKDVPSIGIKIFKQIATTLSQRVRFANGRLADVLDQAHQQGIALEDDDEEDE
tara:strand:- start:152 stop:1153 length:1002 start_codon:yes stop_codon:yes gene_type:complete